MKDGLKDIIGRQVAAVVVAKSDKRPPHIQVFLVFTDGSHFEFWGDAFSCGGGVDRTRDIERYVKSGGGEITNVYTNPAQAPQPPSAPSTWSPSPPYQVRAPERLEDVMTRELAAWKLAKQAIHRARGGRRGRNA